MIKKFFNDRASYIIIFAYLGLALWWLSLYVSGVRDAQVSYWFGFAYALIALAGFFRGLHVAQKWGGTESWIGKSIIFLSLGLFGEWFGQTVWTYYNAIAQLEVPYPSIADIGYFAIIPCYALGMYFIAKASGTRIILRSIHGKLLAIVLPILMFLISYIFFLKDLQIDLTTPIKTFLDYGYPVGEAIVISIALTTYSLSKGVLGGKMKNTILFLIFAIVVQYITDSLFLYRIANEIYFNGDFVDFMYLTSFTLMALAIDKFNYLGDE